MIGSLQSFENSLWQDGPHEEVPQIYSPVSEAHRETLHARRRVNGARGPSLASLGELLVISGMKVVATAQVSQELPCRLNGLRRIQAMPTPRNWESWSFMGERSLPHKVALAEALYSEVPNVNGCEFVLELTVRSQPRVCRFDFNLCCVWRTQQKWSPCIRRVNADNNEPYLGDLPPRAACQSAVV